MDATETVEPDLASPGKYCELLIHRMHLTRGSRYQAARRHKFQSSASTWSITALSMYVFSASSYIAIYDLSNKPNVEKPLILMTIIMSAFIIAFSALEQGKKHDLKHELFLRCAQGLQEIRDKLSLEMLYGTPEKAEIVKYTNSYNELVHDFSENHTESDYRTFRIYSGRADGNWIYNLTWKISYWLDCWIVLLISVFLPPLSLFLILIYSVLTP